MWQDPSIYTVLTCATDTPGVAACDFVVFPPRWMVMEHSFRPPWYHRNCMSEFMGAVAPHAAAARGLRAGSRALGGGGRHGVGEVRREGGVCTGRREPSQVRQPPPHPPTPHTHRHTQTHAHTHAHVIHCIKMPHMAPAVVLRRSCMSPHGPDAPTFLGASTAELKPSKFVEGLAFMFESTYMLKLTPWAFDAEHRDVAYPRCWLPLPVVFDGTPAPDFHFLTPAPDFAAALAAAKRA